MKEPVNQQKRCVSNTWVIWLGDSWERNSTLQTCFLPQDPVAANSQGHLHPSANQTWQQDTSLEPRGVLDVFTCGQSSKNHDKPTGFRIAP